MHRVVPELIVKNFRERNYSGEFQAVSMFLDLSGFSTMTDALMQHGQHGAEALAGLMHGLFDPLVESIFAYGGKIVGFAGDGIMALYPVEADLKVTALRALTSADVIQNKFRERPTRQTIYGAFSIFAKIGLGSGSVSWGILRSAGGNQAAYYFRGTAVDEATEAEHHAGSGEILLSEFMYELLHQEIEATGRGSYGCFSKFSAERPKPTAVVFPAVDLHVARKFMPEDVIVNDLRGEFRQVVNLFMRFPDLSSEALENMMSTVFDLRNRYGGLVSRLDFGDKGCNMLMLWGAPVAYENDIGRALNFLLDLKSAMDFPITAGVTYYISHAGYLGSSLYEDYTCYGWGVNLASRFMMAAKPGETWVDDRIARRVARRFELDYVGSQVFKGFASQQKVYLLRGYTQVLEPQYQGELVGRKEELAQLASFTEPLWQGKFAGLLLISGEAGIGKGRLVHEFHSSTRLKGKKALWAICQSNQILRQSFNPLRSWLFRYFGISRNQSHEEQKQVFDTKLNDLLESLSNSALTQELQRTRSILGALLNLRWDDSLYEQLDAEGRYNNTFLALIALIKAESLRQPVILVLEDFQFTDKDTRDVLPRLKRAILSAGEPYPIAILVTTRLPGHGLAKELIDARMDLRAISAEAMALLMEVSLGAAPSPDLVNLLMERSEGNPYFAEQILRYLQEENLIEISDVGWRLVREIEEGFLPGDIRSVLVARLDQLRREVREAIQTASVLGREFEIPLLEHMWREDDRLHEYISEAEHAAVWNPSDDLHYIFSHGLLRDAAYEMQMQARRKELHALAVHALESLYSENQNRLAELAHHAKSAEQGAKAQKYYGLAAKVAAESYQNHQAVEYYKLALAFTPLNDLSAQFDILMERVEVLNRLGNRTAQIKDLEKLISLATQVQDPERLLQAKVLHARYCFITGDYPHTIEISNQVVEMSKELGEADLALGVYIVWSQALLRLGNLEEAQKHGEEGLEIARVSGQRVEEGRSLSSLGLIALESKEPGMARKYLEEAVTIAQETNERALEARALGNLANAAAFIQKEYAMARTYYERAKSLNLDLGDRYALGIALGNIGWVCGMLGDFAAAQEHHEQALKIAREIGNVHQETYTLMNLSKVAEIQGHAEEALEYALDATELSTLVEDKTAEAWSHLYLGHAYLVSAQFGPAKAAFENALTIRRTLGQASLATEPLAGLIQVALQTGDHLLLKTLVEELITYLSDDPILDATEEPIRVYLACYEALDRMNDSRSFEILDKANQLLDKQISNLGDEQSRTAYIENVPWRRAIKHYWMITDELS
jgi:predicted ATPase/class 3 adenylate cyclase